MKVLIIAQNEICYNPRLIKAGDFFSSKGCDVTVLNPVVGFAKEEVYQDFLKKRNWNVLENRLDKKTIISYLRWGIVGVSSKLFVYAWKKFNSNIGFTYILCKSMFLTKRMATKEKYDIIITNLQELLPYAVFVKEQNPQAKLIFDSQEYFVGQYSKYEKYKFDWIVEAGNRFIPKADIVLSTTSVMKKKLVETYKLEVPVIRVRNVPSRNQLPNFDSHKVYSNNLLKLVWHGMTVNFGNCRGVHILVEALAHCKTNVHLYLQGRRVEADYQRLKERALKLGVWNKISLLPPAGPEDIIDSILGFDVGLIGELPEEENQLLTSSNKLFDFIGAGLCTIAPNLPGLSETIVEYNTGFLYTPGNFEQLADIIDRLNFNRNELCALKANSLHAASSSLYWENDFEKVWNHLAPDEIDSNSISLGNS